MKPLIPGMAFLVLLLLPWLTQAQITITVGTGTVVNTANSYPSPYSNYYWGSKHQFLVRASELTASGAVAGNISSLAFDVAGVQGTALVDFTIGVRSTIDTALSSIQTGFTQVFSAASYTESVGWNTHQFSAPFFWDGFSNIIVETCFNNSGFTSNAIVNQSTLAYDATIYFRADAPGVCASTNSTGTFTNRPNMQFGFLASSGTDLQTALLLSPQPLALGSNNVSVRFTNLGGNTISTASMGYQLNSETPVTAAHTFSPALASGQFADLSFATPLNITAPGTYTLKVWNANANDAGADANTSNDTLVYTLCTGLSGTYTIGGSGASYPDIASTVADLVSCGVAGPVTLAINNGTYYGSYALIGIAGTSATNTITFTSASGNAADVVLVHDTVTPVSGARHTFSMNQQSHVSFSNLTFQRVLVGTALSANLMYDNGSSFGNVSGCRFVDLSGSTSTFNQAIRMNSSDGMQITNNQFEGFYYGAYLFGTSANSTYSTNSHFTGNTFSNYRYGLFLQNASQFTASNNLFNDMNQLSTFGYGLYVSRGMGFEVSNNQVLGRLGTAGLYFFNANRDATGVLQNRVYNNLVSGMAGTGASSLSYGIFVSGSYSATATAPINPHDQLELAHNTINIALSSSTTSAFGGIHVSGGSSTTPATAQLTLRNNLVNARPGTTGSLPLNYAGIYFSGSFIVDSTSSNYNNVYLEDAAGLPASNAPWRVLSTNFATAADFALQFGQEMNSYTLAPNFISPSIPRPTTLALDNKGTPVAYVNTDITGASRSSSTPDIGAYEFTGAAFSSIVHLPLGDTIASANRSFTAEISDSLSALVNGSARVFYRKGLAGAWALAVASSNSGSTYSFSIDYSAIGGVVASDTVYYYLAVENAAGIVTTAPLGGTDLTLAGAVAPPVLYSYRINASMTGTYTIGVSAQADFPTITAAAQAYNQAFIAGPLNLVLIDTLYSSSETFPIVFNHRPGVSATNPVKFFPSPNISHSRISGQSGSNSAIVLLNGVKHFTIDGSKIGLDTRDLTIENTASFATTAVIQLISTTSESATHVTIKNLQLIGGSNANTGTFGVIAGGTLVSTTSQAFGIENLKILNNKIENVFYGIDVTASIQLPSQQLEISNNEIGSWDTLRTVTGRAIQIDNVQGAMLNRNYIYNMYSLLASNTIAIDLSGTVNSDVSINYNRINGVINRNTGGWGAIGVNVTGGQVQVVNNIITNLSTINYSATSNLYNAFGIRFGGSVTAEVYYNSINVYGDYTNTATNGASGAALCWIGSLSGTIQNNIFNVNLSSNSSGAKVFSALWGPTGFAFNNLVIDNNAYFVAPNSEHSVGRLGTGTSQVLAADVAAWRALTSVVNGTNDVNSIPLLGNELAPFTSNVNLEIPSGTVTFAESGGVLIPSLSNIDLYGQQRPAFGGTAPDMGALEFAGVRPVFIAPIQIDSALIDPATPQCQLVSRAVSAYVSSGAGVQSGQVNRWINGNPASSVSLSLLSGTAFAGSWSGTLPAASNSGDLQEFELVFVDSLGDTSRLYLGSVIDEVLSVNAGADQTITRGDVATLTATISGGLGGNGTLQASNLGGNGANGITFNVSAQQNLRIDTLFVALYGSQQGVVNVWQSNMAINGPPNISPANGWIPVVQSYPVQIFNSNFTAPFIYSAIPIPGGIELLAGETFGFHIGTSSGNVAYTTYNTTLQDVFTDQNMTIATGPNVGYGGPVPSPPNHPRMFNGAIAYSIPGAQVVWSAYSPNTNALVAEFGTDTTTNLNNSYPAPYGNWYWGAKHQMMITANELLAQGIAPGGEISALSFDVAVPMGTPLTDFTISMGHTGANSVGVFQTGLQPVFYASTYVDSAGWNRHAFQVPFAWDGVSNIIIETCFNNGNYTNNARMRYSTTSFVSTAMYYNDATGVCASSAITQSGMLRPNMRLESNSAVVGTGLSIQVSPQTNTVYRATATKGSCSIFDEVLVTVNQPNNLLIGQVRYNNSTNTPLNNVDVYLVDLATNTVVAQALLDSTNGQFSFSGFTNGTYYLWSQTTRAWGGVNATDALAVGNHFIGSMPLNPLPQYAGDVNGSNVLNSTDALLIARRFVGYDNSFVVGDWAFETPVITASGNGLIQQDVFALCFGDVNGSYQPGNNRLQPQMALEMQEMLAVSQDSRWVPVRIDRDVELGALSLVLQLPVGMEVLDVRSALGSGQFDFQRRGQELRISWFSTTALQMKENDVLFNLEVAATSNWTGEVAIGGLSEAANGLAEAYPMVKLRLPALRSALHGEFTATVYPNPANEAAQLQYTLPEAGKVSIRLTDALGREVLQINDSEQGAGLQLLSLDTYRLAAGTYHVQLNYQQGQQLQQKMLKLQVVR